MSYKLRTTCRACQGTELVPVFDLGVQPLANDHKKPGEACQGFYPLAINRCDRCGLAQLSVVVDPQVMYEHYTYTTSTSDTMFRHFQRLLTDIESEKVRRNVVEIGSNTGALLNFMAKHGKFQTLGVEPAKNLAAMAETMSVSTIAKFFNFKAVSQIQSRMPHPGVVLARHVFAHIDDWQEFMACLEGIADRDTLVCIEVPWVKDLLERVEFDSVYAEHLSYVSLKPVAHLLKATPFHIHRVIRYSIHGGALLIMLRRNDSGVPTHLSADEFLAEENITAADWQAFHYAAHKKIAALKELVGKLRLDGKIVSAFGASAKATVLLNACKFTTNQIAFVTDNSPLKPGCLVPGTGIPIIEEGQMLSEHPDYVILTAWNYREEILAKNAKYRSRGGKFIIPGKEVEII